MSEGSNLLRDIDNWIWGPPLLILLIGTGIYLTILLKGMQFRYLLYAMRQAIAPQASNSEGDISQFQALMTSLAGAIGTGTIVGVSTAITVGGVGSMFWMWVTAFIGMATKYSESLLAVKFRSIDDKGEMMGGPMQYMERGLGWKGTAMLFAFFASIAAIGTGNLLQANAIAETAQNMWSIEPVWTGVVVAIIVAIVLIGGVKSIGNIATVLVPFMAIFYIGAGLIIMILHIDKVPEAFSLIISSAFSGQAAFGGFAGATVMMTIQMGVARSVISNEAGLGISSIAAAAAKTDNPGRQAMITMTGALISTVIVCSITGIVLAVTDTLGMVNEKGIPLTGATMAIQAFSSTIIGGDYIVSIGLILFAFTTIIAWGYYGEKCFEYLVGERPIMFYRLLFAALIIPGAILQLETVWYVANIFNGLMAIPNLIALVALSGVIVAETNLFLKTIERESQLKADLLSKR
jgi:AGCS family alanine or glycine:cation symporter